ncbi:restriction endonuclease subunit S [Sorangium sp. So ce1000]|uniref:restriction endonuclease subunit S n=1 Tax=Sorangium sp. So ce1000 TaxID=3133325 RepID=UPI003F5DA0D0
MSELPNGWIDVRLSDISRRVTDGTHLPPKFVDAGIPFIVIGNVIRGQIDWAGVSKWVTKETYEEFTARCRPEQGDILYTAVGSYGVAVPVETDRRFMFQRHIAHIKPHSNAVDTRFLTFALNSPQIKASADEVARGVAQKTVTLGDLKEFQIPLPPLTEQRRIVAKVEALTARSRRAKEALDAIPALLERFRQSVLAAAFRGDLTADWREKNPDAEPAEELLKRIRAERRRRWEEAELAKMRAKGKVPGDDRWKEKYEEPAPVDASELPELPEGWAWSNLATVAAVKGGLAKGSKRGPNDVLQSVPYLRVANVQRGFLNLDEVHLIEATTDEIAQLKLIPGDVLFNEGGDRDKLGRGWIWSGELDECIHQNHVFRARPFLPELKSKLLSWYGNTYGQAYFVDEGKQTTNLASLSLSKLCELPVPVPPSAEQDVLVRCIDAQLASVGRVATLIHDLRQRANILDRAILAKAFRGELVPQDPNDEPASILLERLRAEREQNAKTANGAGRRRATASPPPAPPDPTVPGRKAHASRRSQAPARSRG